MLQELDYDYQTHHDPKADAQLAIKFFTHPVKDDEASQKAGRLICVDTEFVEIRVRGDRNNINQRPVREDDKQRFKEAYRAFRAGEAETLTGTPLDKWTQATPSLVEEFKYLGVHTVEQLSELSDSVCGKFAGMQDFKQKAKRFIEQAKGEAPLSKMQSDLDEMKNQLEVALRNAAEQAAELKILKAERKVK